MIGERLHHKSCGLHMRTSTYRPMQSDPVDGGSQKSSAGLGMPAVRRAAQNQPAQPHLQKRRRRMRAIFISYRRDDTEGQAGRLFQQLRESFGEDMVFMDVATIEPGVDFRKAIEKNTAACGVLLALIGRDWVSLTDAEGHRRLDNPDDFVRLETASALRRDIPVIPVLVQGARMPRADELPADLKDLAYRNSVELTHARWDSDVALLVKALRPFTQPPPVVPDPPKPVPPRIRWLLPASGVVALAVAAAGWVLLRPKPDDGRPPFEVAAASPTTTPATTALPPKIGAADGGHATPPLAKIKADPKDHTDASAKEKAAAATQAKAKADADARAKSQAQAQAQAEADAKARADADARAAAVALAAQQAADKAASDKAASDKAAADKLAEDKSAADKLAAANAAQAQAHRDGICITGFVWREAGPGDKVCVTPPLRTQAAAENRAAGATRQPGGGPYGPNTCKQGYVWREAMAGDVVCVVPASRQQAAADNAAAASRVVPLPLTIRRPSLTTRVVR